MRPQEKRSRIGCILWRSKRFIRRAMIKVICQHRLDTDQLGQLTETAQALKSHRTRPPPDSRESQAAPAQSS